MTVNSVTHKLKTRFCPSPTGFIHLGNVRTALFNALVARQGEGTFLLRIEDTDAERSDPKYTAALQRDLKWLGLEWDEGPDKDMGNGPYHQSKRDALYADYYQRLIDMDLAYHCFCTAEELSLQRKLQRQQGKPPRYTGVCACLSADEVQAKLDQGLQPTLRFRVPENDQVKFTDLVRGEQIFQTADIGDFIIRRANGTSPFMFCNAIDDALMAVSHVIRGEDHLTNTPRQIMILEALNLPVPQYAHIALIVGNDGSPLSKRHGSRSIEQLRSEGYLPMAINNYLARLGHYYTQDHFMTLAELASNFNTANFAKSAAKFDAEQLHHWQKLAISQLDNPGLWSWLSPHLQDLVPEHKRELFLDTVVPNIMLPNDAVRWAEVLCAGKSVFKDRACPLVIEHPNYFQEAITALQNHGSDFKKLTEHLKTTCRVKGKALYEPLRLALTGVNHGPELAKIMQLLGSAEIQQRLEAAAHECRTD